MSRRNGQWRLKHLHGDAPETQLVKAPDILQRPSKYPFTVAALVATLGVRCSRHNPQFNKTSLPKSLEKAGIGYVHLPGLGGLRHASPDSINLGWRNASFRGYADYMQKQDFENNLQELIRLAQLDRIALMCAEAVPWRCHRSLIADALFAHGIRAQHITGPTRLEVHTLTAFARMNGTKVSHPSEDRETQLELFSVKTKGVPRPE